MRYLPLTPENRREMLKKAGVSSVEEFYDDIPVAARLADPVDLPFARSEWAVERAIAALAAENLPANAARAFFLGGGAYRHHVPASVDHIIQRSEFLTSYTPYQPEIAQGTLQSLFEFQSQIAILTGMEVANSSMYDGASASAEAALMAARVTKRRKIILSGGLHPHYAETIATVAGAASLVIERLPAAINAEAATLGALDDDTACIVVQSPNFFGALTDISAIADAAHAQGALLVFVFTELISLGLLKPPGEMGADIVVGEGQSLGNGLNFGGPYVGLFAAREKFLRQMPGRLAGETVDLEGRRGFVLTLSAREQHIRRERATSNICTNSGLCALALTAHLTLLGGAGLHALARLNHEAAILLADALVQIPGITLETPNFFNELTVRLPRPAAPVVDRLAREGILAGLPASRLMPDAGLDDLLILAATELNQPDDYPRLAAALSAALVD